MVREEVRRQLSTVSAASSEHAHQDAAVEHDGKNRHHNASHGALMNVPAHQHAPIVICAELTPTVSTLERGWMEPMKAQAAPDPEN